MKIKLSLKRSCFSGETIDSTVSIHLRNCYTMSDVIETIKHEELHALINKFCPKKTTGKMDHFILKRMDIDSF